MDTIKANTLKDSIAASSQPIYGWYEQVVKDSVKLFKAAGYACKKMPASNADYSLDGGDFSKALKALKAAGWKVDASQKTTQMAGQTRLCLAPEDSEIKGHMLMVLTESSVRLLLLVGKEAKPIGEIKAAIQAAPQQKSKRSNTPAVIEDPIAWLQENAEPMRSGKTYLTIGFSGGLTSPTISEYSKSNTAELAKIIGAAVGQYGASAGQGFHFQEQGNKIIVAFDAREVSLKPGSIFEDGEGTAIYIAK